MKKLFYFVLAVFVLTALEICITTFRATVNLGESSLYTEKDLRSAVFVIQLDCLTDRDYYLKRLRYMGDEQSLIKGDYYSHFQDEYGEFDECAVFTADYHSPRHWSREPDDTDWELILVRKSGGRWRILTQGEG